MGPKNDIHSRKVSAIKYPLHRGFALRVRLLFHPFLRKVSVVERCPLQRMFAMMFLYSKEMQDGKVLRIKESKEIKLKNIKKISA